jgi:hypothetical protein
LLPEAVVYMSLLSRAERQVTERGISFRGNQYASARLLEERALRGHNFKAEFCFHPYRPREIYWLTPSGALDRLHRDAASERANGKQTFDEMHLHELKLNAIAIADAARPKKPAKKKSMVTGSQRDNLLRAAGLPTKKVRSRPTPNEDAMRKLTGAINRAQSDYDKPERHAPKLAGGPPQTPGIQANRQPELEPREHRHPSAASSTGHADDDSAASMNRDRSEGNDQSDRVSAADLYEALWNKEDKSGGH